MSQFNSNITLADKHTVCIFDDHDNEVATYTLNNGGIVTINTNAVYLDEPYCEDTANDIDDSYNDQAFADVESLRKSRAAKPKTKNDTAEDDPAEDPDFAIRLVGNESIHIAPVIRDTGTQDTEFEYTSDTASERLTKDQLVEVLLTAYDLNAPITATFDIPNKGYTTLSGRIEDCSDNGVLVLIDRSLGGADLVDLDTNTLADDMSHLVDLYIDADLSIHATDHDANSNVTGDADEETAPSNVAANTTFPRFANAKVFTVEPLGDNPRVFNCAFDNSYEELTEDELAYMLITAYEQGLDVTATFNVPGRGQVTFTGKIEDYNNNGVLMLIDPSVGGAGLVDLDSCELVDDMSVLSSMRIENAVDDDNDGEDAAEDDQANEAEDYPEKAFAKFVTSTPLGRIYDEFTGETLERSDITAALAAAGEKNLPAIVTIIDEEADYSQTYVGKLHYNDNINSVVVVDNTNGNFALSGNLEGAYFNQTRMPSRNIRIQLFSDNQMRRRGFMGPNTGDYTQVAFNDYLTHTLGL